MGWSGCPADQCIIDSRLSADDSIKAFFPGEDYDYTKLVNHEPTWRMLLPMVVMTALAVILGIWPAGLMKIFADIAASVL